jgi:hypothetical protein
MYESPVREKEFGANVFHKNADQIQELSADLHTGHVQERQQV